MPNVLVNDVILVTLKGTLFGQTVMNTFAYKIKVLTVARTIDAFSFELHDKLRNVTSFVDEYMACVPNNYMLDEMWIQDIRPTRYARETFVIGDAGGNAAATTVSNVAATITKRGPFANHRNLGGVHIPISPDADGVDNGIIGQPLLGDLLLFAASMAEPVLLFGDATEVVPVIVNTNGQFQPQEYLNAFPQTTVRVSRRRTVGLGI